MRAAVEEYVNQKLIELNLKIDSAVDRDYAVGFFKIELKKFNSILSNNGGSASQYIYHKYLMGENVEMIIKSEEFYRIFYPDNELLFQKVVAHGDIDTDKVNVELDAKMNEGGNRDAEFPPFENYQFCLSKGLYDEISIDTFDFICLKEVLRAIQKHIENLELNNKQNPIVPNTSLENDNSNNVFNNVRIEKVRAFFGQLCDDDKLVLTEAELGNFISRAFHGDLSIEKQTLKTTHIKKVHIINLFHRFYKKCKGDWKLEYRRNCIEKYKGLLTENFTNWEQAGKLNNFSRDIMPSIWKDDMLK
jgi:hypothetical protein